MAAIRGLPLGSALARAELGDVHDWTHLAANVADLVDLLSFWLRSEYARWTSDPEEIRKELAARKKRGWKPPAEPLIPPVAARPPSVHERHLDAYVAAAAQYATMGGSDTRPRERATVGEYELITSDEFDRALGL